MKAHILSPNLENVQKAIDLLKAHQVVGIPTETVYGLAGNAFDENALLNIYSIKERPTFDPLIVHISKGISAQKLEEMGMISLKTLSEVSKSRISTLMEKFWPGPLTLIFPKGPQIPDLVTSGLDTVAIRCPSHPVAQTLLKHCGFPLAAPSANRFGRISPTSAEDVAEELGDRIELILDGGFCEIGLESTVVHVKNDHEVLVLRPGGVGVDAIEEILNLKVKLHLKPTVGVVKAEKFHSPGLLENHYAPRTPLFLLPERLGSESKKNEAYLKKIQSLFPKARRVGLLVCEDDTKVDLSHLKPDVVRSLCEKADAKKAAKNLFSALRYLDHQSLDYIICEPWLLADGRNASGLGFAIQDRLTKASTKLS